MDSSNESMRRSSGGAGRSAPARFTRQEWTLIALGLGVWIALAFGGVWFVHQFTRSKASCGGQIEARTTQPKGQAAGPRNSLQLLTGTGRCQ
jgi:flagellar biogenesis protein FliO